MNASSTFRLPVLTGVRMALVVAMVWLGRCDMQGAQSSFGNVGTPVAGAPVDPPWPSVNWGIQPEEVGGLVDKESTPWLRGETGSVVVSLCSAKGNVILNFGARQDLGLGPVVSVVAPTLDEVHITGPTGKETGPMRLGNVTFNQAADSLNVWQNGVAMPGDLSRQFQTATTTPNVVQSSAISGWAIAGIAAIAVIIAMAIGFYENDRDDRKRRRSSRKSRRRHRPAS